MTTFTSAVQNQTARTANNMAAFKSTGNACTNLFFKIGASRGQDIIPDFVAAFVEDADKALRIAQWARDVRGGAGERELFRNIMKHLEITMGIGDPRFVNLLNKVSELGRWDDLFIFNNTETKNYVYSLVKTALSNGNGLCSKWTPRKSQVAIELRNYLGLSPKAYRKLIVGLSNTTEQKMCSNTWSDINFAQVPSLCHARNKKAFNRHTPKYAEYVAALVKGESTINAGAVYPYDVLKGLNFYDNNTELNVIIEQWNTLENFIGDASILPLVDVSGSMNCPVGGNKNLTCLDVAVSMGLYCADKNSGAFNGTFLTFSTMPELLHLKGNIVEKYHQMITSEWAMSTNLHSAFDTILRVAIEGKVPQQEMPKTLLIFSDMQFNECISFDDTAFQMITRKYTNAGYDMPKIVFWNLSAYDNVPVKFDQSGVALVSGFSPVILKAIINNDMEQFTPENIMNNTIMVARYDLC